MPLRYLLLAACLLGAALGACGSTAAGAGEDGAAIRVTLRDYRSGKHFELRSESHTDKVELYSQARRDAAIKVQEDRFVAGLLEFFASEGFERLAHAGSAPLEGAGQLASSLEVEREGEVVSWALARGSAAEDQLAFQRCVAGFLELYNETKAYQTVEVQER